MLKYLKRYCKNIINNNRIKQTKQKPTTIFLELTKQPTTTGFEPMSYRLLIEASNK